MTLCGYYQADKHDTLFLALDLSLSPFWFISFLFSYFFTMLGVIHIWLPRMTNIALQPLHKAVCMGFVTKNKKGPEINDLVFNALGSWSAFACRKMEGNASCSE